MFKKRASKIIYYIILVSLSIVSLIPLVWAVSSSLQTDTQIFNNTMPFSWKALIPINPTTEAYQTIFFVKGFGRALVNSFTVAIVTVIIGIAVNSMCGFAFAVFDFKAKGFLFLLVLVTFMIPFEAIAIPLFQVASRLRLINTRLGLILPAIANGLVIFLFRQYFMGIPKDYIEAARIDGGSWWTIFYKLYMPMAKSAIISASLILFLFQWEAFLWPFIAVGGSNLQVIQVAIAGLSEEAMVRWNQIFAGSVVAIIIPVLLILPLQHYYVGGITAGGVKE